MGHHDPDNRPGSLPESQPRPKSSQAAPREASRAGGGAGGGGGQPRHEPRPAAVGSLMSVQIRRSRAPRKQAPCGPAPRAPANQAANQAADPAATGQIEPRHGPRPEPRPEPRRREEISAYWTRLRGNHSYPAVSDLDPELIAADWPNSILFRCRAGSGALMPDMSFLPRQDGGPGGGPGSGQGPNAENGKIQLSPMMLQWLVSLAEDAVHNQRPVEDLESFPSARRAIGYRAVALPLSDDHSEIGHVLCHVKYA